MKKIVSLIEDKKTENNCECCKKWGTGDIVNSLIKQDVRSDMKKQKRGRPKKQIEVFLDKKHTVMSRFYDLMDQNISDAKMIKGMEKLISEDRDFLDPYLTIADILFSDNKDEQAALILKEAYERALMIIVDDQGRWPQEIPWGFLENRHIMRAIERQAIFYWETGKIDEALCIFGKLLKVNPQDNQGVRYNILAIRMNLNIDEWEKPFEVQEDGKIIGLDGFKVYKWFEENAPKFENDFKWLLDLYRSWDADAS